MNSLELIVLGYMLVGGHVCESIFCGVMLLVCVLRQVDVVYLDGLHHYRGSVHM